MEEQHIPLTIDLSKRREHIDDIFINSDISTGNSDTQRNRTSTTGQLSDHQSSLS